MSALACRAAQWTADLFGNPWACVVFGAATIASLVWCVASPSMLAAGVMLSLAALWASAGIQYTTTNDTKAMLAMNRELVRAVPEARNEVAEEDQ